MLEDFEDPLLVASKANPRGAFSVGCVVDQG